MPSVIYISEEEIISGYYYSNIQPGYYYPDLNLNPVGPYDTEEAAILAEERYDLSVSTRLRIGAGCTY